MKVIILSRGVPSKENPQEGCFEWDQARALKSIGISPIVIYLDARLRKHRHKWGLTSEFKEGIETHRIYGGTTTIIEHLVSHKLAWRYNEWLVGKLIAHVKNLHPDARILHAHYLHLIYLASKLGHKYNMKVVGTEHLSNMAHTKIDKKLRIFGEKAYCNVEKLISVSSFLKDCLKKEFQAESVICGNVLGPEFIATPCILQRNNEGFNLVSCGSLIPRKGYEMLIDAFYKASIPNASLTIIGEGPLRKKLAEKIVKLSLENKVRLVGRKPKNEIIEILDKSDCFVLSSFSETFGVVAIEALSRGLPVITTRCGGVEDIVNPENGFYTSDFSIESMANAMQKMHLEMSTFKRENIRKKCLSKFSSEAIANKLKNIYREIYAES